MDINDYGYQLKQKILFEYDIVVIAPSRPGEPPPKEPGLKNQKETHSEKC